MRRLALLAIAFGLLVAACTDSAEPEAPISGPTTAALVVGEDPLVATVNGTEISMSRVQPMHPFRPDAVPPLLMANILRDVIIQEIVVQAATTEFGVGRDEAEVNAKYEEIKQGIIASRGDYEAFLVTENRTDYSMRELAFQSVVREQITEAMAAELPPLTDEELNNLYELQLPALTQICVSRIIVETQAEGEAAVARLEAGESFADVAADVSIEQGAAEAGGYIGCVPPTSFPDVFSEAALDAPLGEPAGPIETQFGYHVFLVDSRFVPTLEEAKPLIEAGRRTQIDLEFSDWVNGLIGAAVVVVEPEFGTWTLLPVPGVQPPGA